MTPTVTVVTAVPGSGKTRHIVLQAADRVMSGKYTEEQIICLTFSREAAAELQRRLTKFPGITASTIHSLAGSLLPEHGADMTYDAVILSATTSKPVHGFKSIFIDEAQDLTKIQRDFLVEVCRSADEVTIVGDPMQSIYQFNGSSEQYMYDLARMLNPEPNDVRLHESYRCGAMICHTLEQGFHTGIQAAQRHVDDVLWYDFDSDEARAQQLIETVRSHSGLILTRTNAEITRLLRLLPPKCCNAQFTVSDHPYLSMLRLKRGTVPVSRREFRTLLKCYGLNDYTTSQALAALPETLNGLELLELLKPTMLSKTQSALHTFLWSVKMTLDMLPEDPELFMTSIGEHLALVGIDYIPIQSLVAAVKDDGGQSFRITVDNGQPFTIMTMHAAKGLEGETVIIFPDELGDMSEDEHLLYVAMSRASHQLWFYHGPESSRCDELLRTIIPMV